MIFLQPSEKPGLGDADYAGPQSHSDCPLRNRWHSSGGHRWQFGGLRVYRVGKRIRLRQDAQTIVILLRSSGHPHSNQACAARRYPLVAKVAPAEPFSCVPSRCVVQSGPEWNRPGDHKWQYVAQFVSRHCNGAIDCVTGLESFPAQHQPLDLPQSVSGQAQLFA